MIISIKKKLQKFMLSHFFSGAKIDKHYDALDELIEIAKKGNTLAQFSLVGICESGSGTARAHGFTWLEMAAESGYPEAISELAKRYASGERGAIQSDIKAYELYLRAAEKGHALSQCNLGVMLKNGRGIEKDEVAAFNWLLKAAETGDDTAQCLVGVMYSTGCGVAQNDDEAITWLGRSATQGNRLAQFNVGSMYSEGRGVELSLENAAFWFEEAAERGDMMAQFNLGVMFSSGQGVEEDQQESMIWYLKAAAQGHVRAMFNLGELYITSGSNPTSLNSNEDLQTNEA
jgi:TPR repeat protein